MLEPCASAERAKRVEGSAGDRIAVVRNPRSGTAPEPGALAAAFRSANIEAAIHDCPERGFQDWLDGVARGADVLVAAGGDGTVSTVAAAASRAGKVLAILPTGTLNHFARDAGIPDNLEEAARLIHTGRRRDVDVGEVNGRMFLNNVSLGNYPCMVHEREALESQGRSRPVAAAIAIARTWWRLGKLSASLDIDGRPLARRSPFFVIGNGSYTLSGLALGKREQINDGKLSLYIAPSTGRIGVLALPLRAVAGTLERHEQFESFCATRITAAFRRRRIEAGIDGEVTILDTPIEFTIRRAGLKVLVP